MKLYRYFLILFLTQGSVLAQNNFKPGYFIDNNGEVINCSILDESWSSNPSSFKYRLNDNSEVLTGSIENAKEFHVNGADSYIRFLAKIDMSSNNTNNLSKVRNPEFKEEIVFLKLLVKGKINLFSFLDGKQTRFFISEDMQSCTPLVFKIYETTPYKFKTNEQYKQQLSQYVCELNSKKPVTKVKYSLNDLSTYFQQYNSCFGFVESKNQENEKRSKLNINIRPGIILANLKMNFPPIEDFGTTIGYRVGLEGELVLPFNNNKWAAIFEPTFFDLNFKQVQNGSTRYEGTYSAIEFPIGARHYMFINQNSSIFLDAVFLMEVGLESSLSRLNADFDINFQRYADFGVGIGYNYNKKIGIEIRTYLSQDITQQFLSAKSEFRNVSVILSYNIL